MEFTCYSMLIDFTIAAIFLFLAKLLREKIKILQSLFIPVSLLAGFLALIAGKNGLKLITFSGQAGSYSGMLIIAVFVSLGLRGFNFSKRILTALEATTACATSAGASSTAFLSCSLYCSWASWSRI